jgi:UDP:flavonoid glycosyltransferase YjiC (YdhE family)
MSRFLFTTLPTNDFGLLTRSLPIARELKLRGHSVIFCHPAKVQQKLISEAGFEYQLFDEPLYSFMADPGLRTFFRLVANGRAVRSIKAIVDEFKVAVNTGSEMFWNIDQFAAGSGSTTFTRANVDALANLIQSSHADAVVDFWNPWACVAARLVKRPLITIMQSHQHPQSPGFNWWNDPPPNLPSIAPFWNDILAHYGLPAIKNTGDLFVGSLTLVVGMPELDPLPDTAQVTYIGAVLWQNSNASFPEVLSAFKSGIPIVWVYTGRLRYAGGMRTSMDSEVVLQASIEALAKEDVQVVLTTGQPDLPRSFLPLPPNFHFEPFVPGLSMAERSNLMIHHGGYGSCQTGVYVGTPEVIIPTTIERESNARRIVEQGAGEMVLPASDSSGKRKKVDSAELSAKVRKVLATSLYKENACRISASFKEYGGAPRAAQLIETAVKSGAK